MGQDSAGLYYEKQEGAGRAPLGAHWEPRRPEKTVLYQVVSENLEALLSEWRQEDEDRAGLPFWVEREFRKYLECGRLERGHVRVRCGRCGKEEIVGFSCKQRGFCPSCIGRRMTEGAADLVDRVLPAAPYRQWVLTMPFRERVRLARDAKLLGSVRKIFVAAVKSWQRLKARSLGWRRVQTGAVCFTQGFDSLLRANPHFHAVVPDAVFVEEEEGPVTLLALPKPKQEDVEWVAKRIARRAGPLLKTWPEEGVRADGLDRLRVRQLELWNAPAAEGARGRLTARVEGFSLQAATHLHAHDRAGLEALCRYALRPPVAGSRLTQGSDGKLLLTLKRPLADGRDRLVLEPMTLMRRLAGLIPRPRTHQVSYFGVLSSHARLRKSVCPRSPKGHRHGLRSGENKGADSQLALPLAQSIEWPALLVGLPGPLVKAPTPRPRRLDWAQLLKRTFGDAVLNCRCGGQRSIVALITDPEQSQKVIEDLGLGRPAPRLGRARAPPQMELFAKAPGSLAACAA